MRLVVLVQLLSILNRMRPEFVYMYVLCILILMSKMTLFHKPLIKLNCLKEARFILRT